MDPVRDGDSLRTFLAGPGPLALLDMPWVPVYLAVVFIIHPFLGWLAVGGAILITILMIINEFVLRKPSKDSAAAANARVISAIFTPPGLRASRRMAPIAPPIRSGSAC